MAPDRFLVLPRVLALFIRPRGGLALGNISSKLCSRSRKFQRVRLRNIAKRARIQSSGSGPGRFRTSHARPTSVRENRTSCRGVVNGEGTDTDRGVTESIEPDEVRALTECSEFLGDCHRCDSASREARDCIRSPGLHLPHQAREIRCHLTQGFLAAVGVSRSPALQRVDRYIGAQGLREIHIVDSPPVKARHQEQWSHAGLAGRKLEQRRRPAHARGGTQQL